jgi:hypothetical protein
MSDRNKLDRRREDGTRDPTPDRAGHDLARWRTGRKGLCVWAEWITRRRRCNDRPACDRIDPRTRGRVQDRVAVLLIPAVLCLATLIATAGLRGTVLANASRLPGSYRRRYGFR